MEMEDLTMAPRIEKINIKGVKMVESHKWYCRAIYNDKSITRLHNTVNDLNIIENHLIASGCEIEIVRKANGKDCKFKILNATKCLYDSEIDKMITNGLAKLTFYGLSVSVEYRDGASILLDVGDGFNEEKIEKYLNKSGLAFMKGYDSFNQTEYKIV